MGILDNILGSITGSGLISAGAGLFGGLLGKEGQEETNLANAQQARDQMDFQERMSSTSYQRGIKDMEAAGLNPMLAYSQGGASTPGGAMATMGNPKLAGVQGAQLAMSTAQQGAAVENTRAQTDNIRADTELKKADMRGDQVDGEDQPKSFRAKLTNEQARVAWYQAKKIIEEVTLTDRQRQLVEQNTRNAIAQESNIRADTAFTTVRKTLLDLDIPGAENVARSQRKYQGYFTNVRPFVSDVATGANSAAGAARLFVK